MDFDHRGKEVTSVSLGGYDIQETSPLLLNRLMYICDEAQALKDFVV